MALVVKDRVQETTTTTGTGTLTLLGAVTGYQSFSVVGNGNTTYYTIASTSSEWEVGIGTWATGNTLARTTVLASSNAGSAVNLSAGTKNVFVTYPAGYSVTAGGNGTNSEFAATTAILFYQAAAPTGWTKSTTHDNKALRVVSGAGGGSGGTTAFTTVFTNQTPTISNGTLAVAATTLTTAQVPSHTHSYTSPGGNVCVTYPFGGCGSTAAGPAGGGTTGSAFTGGSHTHSISGSATSSAITLNVQYIDTIICTKN
jgi:hypothetical protein